MEPMKALIVKSDGLIYAAEVPKEPHVCMSYVLVYCSLTVCKCHDEQKAYERMVASAKESAVLCADQEKAKEIIKEKFGHDLDQMNINTSGYEYPIPDLQWEVKEKHEILRYTSIVTGDLVPHVVSRQVAILKESTNNLKEIVGAFPDFPDTGEMVESQEDIWHDVLRVQEEMSQSKKRLIPELMKYFTITRKP